VRTTAQSSALRVRAIAGSYVVVLGWDTLTGSTPSGVDLLGFAIERSELKNGVVIEKYWLRGIKRFKDKDKGLAPGTPVSTADHPIQSFQWGDYTARAGGSYQYRVVPVWGTPKHLHLDDAASVAVDVITEPEGAADDGTVRHDVFFNRGVIGSQAYAREFENKVPDADDPASPEMVWLSRGLYEALLRSSDWPRTGSDFALLCTSSITSASPMPSPRRSRPAPTSRSSTTRRAPTRSRITRPLRKPGWTRWAPSSRGLCPRASGTTSSSFFSAATILSRCGRAPRTSRLAASSATRTSAISCGANKWQPRISSTGNASRRI